VEVALAGEHQFIQVKVPKANPSTLRGVAADLISSYTGQSLSRTKWLKQKPVEVAWARRGVDANQKPVEYMVHSQPLTLRLIEAQLEELSAFDHETFGLYEPKCSWLDESFRMAQDGTGMVIRAHFALGDGFPITPAIDREGYLCSSFQPVVQQEILDHWQTLLQTSNEFTKDEWAARLRLLFAASVSLIDMTLHQIRTKAEYDPLPSWVRSVEGLGPRTGQRLDDKFGWIYKITGRHLPYMPEERRAFTTIRELRNHTQHLDPPCFGFTLEDASVWMNSIPLVARLAWMLRRHVSAPLSAPLIRLLLLPEVTFVPKNSTKPRVPQTREFGYQSTVWPSGGTE
jgi:hypothetical protein